jgi:hypothetical protein
MHYHNVLRGGEATTAPVVIVVILVVIYVGEERTPLGKGLSGHFS